MFDKGKMSRFVVDMDVTPIKVHLTYVIKIQHEEKVIMLTTWQWMRNQLMYLNQQEQNTMFVCVDAKQDF